MNSRQMSLRLNCIAAAAAAARRYPLCSLWTPVDYLERLSAAAIKGFKGTKWIGGNGFGSPHESVHGQWWRASCGLSTMAARLYQAALPWR